MLDRAGTGGLKADLTIPGCEGGSSRLPLLSQSLLEAILVLHVLWDAMQPILY